MTVYIGSKGNVEQKVNVTLPIHPSLMHAYEILEPYYRECISRQRLLDQVGGNMILQQLDDKLRYEVQDILLSGDLNSDNTTENGESHIDRFQQFKKKIQLINQKYGNQTKVNNQHKAMITSARTAVYKAVFSTIYPRLDINVSKQMNHLLKAPFCVHPKTGRICVPIDPQDIDTFDPITTPPTLATLCEELSHVDSTSNSKYWQQTSLKSHIEYFYRFVNNLIAEERQESKRTKGVKSEANIDF
jgi:DNA primase small subunit